MLILHSLQVVFVILTVLGLAAQLASHVSGSKLSKGQFRIILGIHCITLVLSIFPIIKT